MSDEATQTAEPQAPEQGAQETDVFVKPAEPKRDAIKETTSELRDRLERGESIFPSDEPAADPEPVQDEPAPEPELEAEAQDEPEEPEAPAELDLENLPEGFRLTESGRIQGPDGKFWSQDQVQAHLSGEPVAEGEEATAEAEEGAEEGEEPEEEAFVLELPGRRPDDPDMEVPLAGLSDQEVEAFQRLRNGYMRGEEAKRQIEAVNSQRQELQGLEEDLQDAQVALQTDPVGYITQYVPKEVRADLARHILADDEVYDDVVPELAEWDRDKNVRARRKAELKAERMEQQDKAKKRQQRIRAARANAREITGALDHATQELQPADRQQFKKLAVREIKEYAQRQGVDAVPMDTVRHLLQDAGTLRLFGVSADALVAPQTPGNGSGDNTSPEDDPVPSARPKGSAEERLVRRVSTPDDGERFKEKASKKRSATGSTPTGGPAPSTPAMKEGDTVKDRIELLKKRRKSGGSIRSILSGG